MAMPALATRMSMRPWRLMMASICASVAAVSATSSPRVALPPDATMLAALTRGGFTFDVIDDDGGSLAGQRFRAGAADAAASPGHQGILESIETSWALSLTAVVRCH